MICGHCKQKHDAVVEVARCAHKAMAATKDGVSPAFSKAMAVRFPKKVEVKA